MSDNRSFTTTVISGCIVALFTHWLRTRNNKKK
ncbi:type I toxin-antitoxin system Fst family toxin [Staphylococcus epidermidis]|nr:type I toxin-antitoxin system Fst family toxin [Staphylococcus epidermidis]